MKNIIISQEEDVSNWMLEDSHILIRSLLGVISLLWRFLMIGAMLFGPLPFFFSNF